MQLSEEAVIEFQQLYKARYGQDISVEEARRRAENLMKLYRVTYTDWYPEPKKPNARPQQEV